MALSFSVFNKFKAIDGITAPIRKMTKTVGRFGKKTVTAFRNADRKASKFSKTLKTLFVGAAIIGGIALLNQGIRSVTTQFIEFDDSIIAAGARFKDIGPDVDNFTERIKGIKTAAREAGAITEFTAAQSAKALDFLARAGFKSTEAIGSLSSMINLATASGEDFGTVADMSSDLLGAFGLASDNTAQKIKNLNRLNDVLVKTVNTANVTVTDMFETMKQVGPIATGVLGASLEEVAALTAVLGSSGIKGSEAMTALKNAYLRLAAPGSKAQKIMDALQISIDDGEGGARKMTDLMEELGGKISGLGKIQQAQILNELFGKRAIAGGKNLIDNIKNIRKFEKTLLNAGGTAKKTADLMRTSLGNRLKTLKSSLAEFGFKILESFELKGKDAIDGFIKAIRGIDVKPIVESLKAIVDIAEKLFKIFKDIAEFINDVFIQSFRDVHKMNEEIIPTIGILIGVIFGLKIGMLALKIAVGAFNLILKANPFILLIVGAAAWIVAIRSIIKNWDFLKDDFKLGIEFLGNMFANFGKKISDIILLATDFWINKFSSFGKKISEIFSGIGDFAENNFTNIGGFVENIFSEIGDKFKDFAGGIGGKLLKFVGFGSEDKQPKKIQTDTPISPNAGLAQTIRQETENRSRVSVDFSNLPKGTAVKQTGDVPGFDLALAFSGA